MQRIIRSPTTDLCTVRSGIAAVCHERTRVQREMHEFRHCQRDERHEQWAAELAEIEERRGALLQQQAAIVRRSRECGVGVGRLCI
jgi:hypothetical protein